MKPESHARLGFGTYRTTFRNPVHREALATALRSGQCPVVDTSRNYMDGEAELLVGQVVSDLIRSRAVQRDALQIVTKLGYLQGSALEAARKRGPVGSIPGCIEVNRDCWHSIHPEFLEEQLAHSTQALGPYVAKPDLVLLHNPEYFLYLHADTEEYYRRIEAAFEFLESATRLGRIGGYGVSSNTFVESENAPTHTSLSRLITTAEKINATGFKAIQFPLNLLEPAPSDFLTLASNHHLQRLHNRPFNAIVAAESGERLVRLVSWPIPGPDNQLYDELKEALDFALREESQNPDLGFHWAHRIRQNLERLADYTLWRNIRAFQIEPDLATRGAELEGEARDWFEHYNGIMLRLMAALDAYSDAQVPFETRHWEDLLNSLAPELKQEPLLQRKLLAVYDALPEIDTTLVGMRRPSYAKQICEPLRTRLDAETARKILAEARRALGALVAAALIGGAGVIGSPARAADPLPYTTRTRNFDALGTTVAGDTRTVGMSGATLGLADTFIAALDNPAGLALALPDADAKFDANWIRDGLIQTEGLYFFDSGMAWSGYPWGFSFGFMTTHTEGQQYAQGAAQVTTREFRFGLARSFFEHRLALGVSGVIGQGEWILGGQGYASYTFGGVVGAQFQLPHRFLIGICGTTPMRLVGSIDVNSGAIQQFFRDVITPGRVGLGVGWIPNRFFRLGISLLGFGPTDGASLLKDEGALITQAWVLQPRAGASYNWMDFKELRANIFLGTSLEAPRVQGVSLRPHVSGGLEFMPWVLGVSAGFDWAPGYSNLLAGVGIDLVRLFEKLDLIPPIARPPLGGFLPKPFHLADSGLPRPLVKDWKPLGPAIDPIQVGLKVPQRAAEKAKKTGSDIINAVRGDVRADKKKGTKKNTTRGKP